MPKLIKKDDSIEITELSYNEIKSCPHLILDPSHYTKDSCKCFDKTVTIMKKWGYRWNDKKGMWV